MSKITVDVVEQFESAEPIEVDGALVARFRVAHAKVRRNGKHVADLKIGVRLPIDEDDDPTLTVIVEPTDDELGYDAAQQINVTNGAVALALAELLKSAIPFLKKPEKSDDAEHTSPWVFGTGFPGFVK